MKKTNKYHSLLKEINNRFKNKDFEYIVSNLTLEDLIIAKLEYEQSKKDTLSARSDLAPSASLSFDRSKTEDLSSTYDEREKDI